MELAPSLRRIGSDLVPSYLVIDRGEITIIDAGLPAHYDELATELTALGVTFGDVRGVVLTHGDTDHLGFAERLRTEHGVPVHSHEADAARARGEVTTNGKWGRVRLGPTAKFLAYSARRGGFKIPHVGEVVTFTDGQTLELPGEPRIVHVPGHTEGSVAVHVPALDAVFVGDALTTGHVLTGEQGPQPAPFTLEPDTALGSLSRLEAIEAQWLLPGHGPPWRGGVAEALRRVRNTAAARG